MKKNIYYIIYLFLLLLSDSLYSQEDIKKDLILPTPDAAALGKFGQYPVSLNNGLAQIDIPLYTIKLPLISLPISISYHASGIKVDEISSVVGLGWALNAGGVITRSVKGAPDKLTGTYPKVYDKKWINSLSEYSKPDILWQYYNGSKDEAFDLESDIFYYNVGELSGSFRFDTDGKLVQIPLTNSIIEYNNETFKIINSDGTIYYFGEKEVGVQKNKPDQYTTSWYLSAIETIDGKTISFSYLNDNTSYTEYYINFLLKQGHDKKYIPTTLDHTESIAMTKNTLLLKSIQFPEGKIIFAHESDRKDKRKYRLTKINISNNQNQYIKKFSLDQSYFNPARLRLDALLVLNGEDFKVSSYNFDYNTSVSLPSYFAGPNLSLQSNMGYFGQDMWGYYNGVSTNKTLLVYDKNKVTGSITNSYPPADRSVNSKYTQACILTKIHYPTGGYTEFEYEGNIDDLGNVTGGVRIKEIKSYSKQNILPTVRSYTYTGSRVSPIFGSGFLGDPYTQGTIIRTGGGVEDERVEFADNYISQPLLDVGAYIDYYHVTEYDGYPEDNNGKTEYSFYSLGSSIGRYNFSHCQIPSLTYNIFIPISFFYSKDMSWGKGKPSQIDTYERVGEKFSLVKRIKNSYTVFNEQNFKTGLKVFANFNTGSRNLPIPYKGYQMTGNELFQYDDITAETGLLKLTKTEEISYVNGVGVSQSSTYFYNRLSNQYEVTETHHTTSNGRIQKKTFSYPNDMKASNTIYNKMSARNILTPVIQQTDSIDNKFMKSKYIEYKQVDENIFAPWYIDIKKGIDESRREITYLYNRKYDVNSNILEIQERTNANITYIWGYGQTLPVAKLSNISYESVYTNNTLMSDLNQLQYYTNLDDPSIRSNFTSLNISIRNQLPNALVTTYTYKPLIGMTSATDPSGITTFYDYDAFGRLKETYIMENNIKKTIQSYDYHYQNQ